MKTPFITQSVFLLLSLFLCSTILWGAIGRDGQTKGQSTDPKGWHKESTTWKKFWKKVGRKNKKNTETPPTPKTNQPKASKEYSLQGKLGLNWKGLNCLEIIIPNQTSILIDPYFKNPMVQQDTYNPPKKGLILLTGGHQFQLGQSQDLLLNHEAQLLCHFELFQNLNKYLDLKSPSTPHLIQPLQSLKLNPWNIEVRALPMNGNSGLEISPSQNEKNHFVYGGIPLAYQVQVSNGPNLLVLGPHGSLLLPQDQIQQLNIDLLILPLHPGSPPNKDLLQLITQLRVQKVLPIGAFHQKSVVEKSKALFKQLNQAKIKVWALDPNKNYEWDIQADRLLLEIQ